MDMDYVFLIGAIVVGVPILTLVVYLIYRRGVAIRLALWMALDVSLVGLAAFILGKEGIQPLTLAIIVLVLMPIGTFSVLNIAQRVINPIRQMAEVADRISQGELDQTIDIEGNDELGDMAAAFSRMVFYLQVMATVASRIAEGDLAGTITPHSPKDVLGEAMVKMKRSIDAMAADVNMLAKAAADGRLDVRADASHHQGDFCTIVEGINTTLDGVATPMQAASEALAQIAKGDLTTEMNGGFSGDYAILTDGINTMVDGLRGMTTRIRENSTDIGSAIAEILAASSQMASVTQEQASAVSQIASTVEEIRASADQAAQRAQSVADGASEAAQAAKKGSDAAGDTVASMHDIRQRVESIAGSILSLSEQMRQIGEIIDTVTDIADQSNILALNAAIEAAQAGDAGKGFWVVADEVRRLAEQSRQAAGQVKVILGDIQEATNRAVLAMEEGTKGTEAGSELISRTAQAIRQLASTVQDSAQASQQIVAGVQQQTLGLDQIAVGMSDINQAAQQSAACAQQSRETVVDLHKLVDMMNEMVSQYRI